MGQARIRLPQSSADSSSITPWVASGITSGGDTQGTDKITEQFAEGQRAKH